MLDNKVLVAIVVLLVIGLIVFGVMYKNKKDAQSAKDAAVSNVDMTAADGSQSTAVPVTASDGSLSVGIVPSDNSTGGAPVAVTSSVPVVTSDGAPAVIIATTSNAGVPSVAVVPTNDTVTQPVAVVSSPTPVAVVSTPTVTVAPVQTAPVVVSLPPPSPYWSFMAGYDIKDAGDLYNDFLPVDSAKSRCMADPSCYSFARTRSGQNWYKNMNSGYAPGDWGVQGTPDAGLYLINDK